MKYKILRDKYKNPIKSSNVYLGPCQHLRLRS